MDGQLVEFLNKKISDGILPARALIARAKIYDDCQSGVFSDSKHFPFYYYLGTKIEPSIVMQIGPYLGLPGFCFMQGCKTVKQWFCIGEYSNIVMSNLRSLCKCSIIAESESHLLDGIMADACFVSQNFDDLSNKLEFLWKYLKQDGLLICDYISSSSIFDDFCRLNNRQPYYFNTRYGIGIVEK
jgi:hypothetical protein